MCRALTSLPSIRSALATGGSVVKNPPASVGDSGSIPGSGRSPGEEMAMHSSILAWDIPLTEEPGRAYSPWDCKEVGHNLVTEQRQQDLMLDPMTDWEEGDQALITDALLVLRRKDSSGLWVWFCGMLLPAGEQWIPPMSPPIVCSSDSSPAS